MKIVAGGREKVACLLLLMVSSWGFDSQAQERLSELPPEPLTIGEEIEASLETSHPYTGGASEAPVLVDRQEIEHPGASYISPHFQRMDLAEGDYVVVRSPDARRSWRYKDQGKGDVSPGGGFWAIHIPGDRAVIELYSRSSKGGFGYVIDRYARGFLRYEMGLSQIDICGIDDSQWAPCYEESEPVIYEKSKAVARLVTHGTQYCTGWLLGSEDHLMTNEHCIGDQNEADGTVYELMAEGGDCSTDCSETGACPGPMLFHGATFVRADPLIDYSLVKLPQSPSVGEYLQMRKEGGVLDERIYIPQHPMGWGKRIAVESTEEEDESGFAELESRLEVFGTTLWLYLADTQDGASGAPVIAYQDHKVVAIHHTGLDCTLRNRGSAVEVIIDHLGAELPNDSITYHLNIGHKGSGSGVVSSAPVGISCPKACMAEFGNNRTVELLAFPFAGSEFMGWSGDSDCSDGIVTMNQDITCVANFQSKYLLTINPSGTGACTVISSPPGIDCGDDCLELFLDGTIVELAVNADVGSRHVGWDGDPDCLDGVVAMDDDRICSPICNLFQTLSVAIDGTGSGTLTSDPQGIHCESTAGAARECQAPFDQGTGVVLLATADEDSSFSGWRGAEDCSDGNVQMNEDILCTGSFELRSYDLNVVKRGSESSCFVTSTGINCGRDCHETFTHGTEVALDVEGSYFWWGPVDCSDGLVTMVEDFTCTLECFEPLSLVFQDDFESGDCSSWQSNNGC